MNAGVQSAGAAEDGSEKYRKLALLAIEVAISAPRRFSKYGTCAYIPRELVTRIRAECERLGIDWVATHKKVRP